MVTVMGLQHVGIIVADAEAAADWYTEKSGFARKATFFANGSKAVFVVNPDAGVMLELIQRPEGDPTGAQPGGGYIDHLAYQVADCAVALAQAEACGMDLIEGVVDIPTFWENGFQYVLVRGAGGEKVEYCKVL